MKLLHQLLLQTNIKKITISSPLTGEIVPLTNVKDEVFSSGAMGNGIAIMPIKGELYAPIDGKITALYPSGHALGITSKSGMEIILHIGIDTVELNGEGFIIHVKSNQFVKRSDLLISFNIERIKSKGYSPITMVLVVNSDKFGTQYSADGNVFVGNTLLWYES